MDNTIDNVNECSSGKGMSVNEFAIKYELRMSIKCCGTLHNFGPYLPCWFVYLVFFSTSTVYLVLFYCANNVL